jgi:hypothetical protein
MIHRAVGTYWHARGFRKGGAFLSLSALGGLDRLPDVTVDAIALLNVNVRTRPWPDVSAHDVDLCLCRNSANNRPL